MPRRYVQIDGRGRGCYRHNYHRLRVDERRWTFISNTHLTVHARGNLARKYDVYIQSVGLADSDRRQQPRGKHYKTHTGSPD